MGSQLMKKAQVDQQIVPDIRRVELAGTNASRQVVLYSILLLPET